MLSCTKHSISVLRSSKPVILCIEALTWLALQKSSNTSKSVFYIANNISFHEKETYFMYLSFTLKIAFSNFLSLRKNFSASWHCILFICLVALNTSLVFLEALTVILCIEALTWLALQKSSNTWKSVFYIANNISFHKKKHLSCTWAVLLKLHLATFSHWEAFQHPWILFICLVALNTALVFLEGLNQWFCALKL